MKWGKYCYPEKSVSENSNTSHVSERITRMRILVFNFLLKRILTQKFYLITCSLFMCNSY